MMHVRMECAQGEFSFFLISFLTYTEGDNPIFLDDVGILGLGNMPLSQQVSCKEQKRNRRNRQRQAENRLEGIVLSGSLDEIKNPAHD